MSKSCLLVCALLMILIPAIEYGGLYLLELLMTNDPAYIGTATQDLSRAGHAHAGVVVMLAILIQLLVDHTRLSGWFEWIVRALPVLASLLLSAGFFISVRSDTGTLIIFFGGALLAVSAVITGFFLAHAAFKNFRGPDS